MTKLPKAGNGFTFIELLIVVSVLLILSLFATPFYARFFIQNSVVTTQDQLISNLRKAQLYSMMGKQNGTWGVSYDSTTHALTLFLQGSASFNETYSVNQNITISNFSQVTFARATGLPTPSGPTTVTISGNNNTKSLTINTQGVVGKN